MPEKNVLKLKEKKQFGRKFKEWWNDCSLKGYGFIHFCCKFPCYKSNYYYYYYYYYYYTLTSLYRDYHHLHHCHHHITITMFFIIIHFILNIIRNTTWIKLTKLKSLLKQYDPNTVKSLIEWIRSSVYLLLSPLRINRLMWDSPVQLKLMSTGTRYCSHPLSK